MPRHGRRDANEGPIVEALRAVGASVVRLSVVDLLVGYAGQTYLLECKNLGTGYGRHGLNANQLAWKATWRGQFAVVHTPLEALAAIGAVATAITPGERHAAQTSDTSGRG